MVPVSAGFFAARKPPDRWFGGLSEREYSNKSDIFRKIIARKKYFSDICSPNEDRRVFPGRNSSAVEHFTRNEGVPSSNLGFGSESQQFTEM